jgi:hypothetical protein
MKVNGKNAIIIGYIKKNKKMKNLAGNKLCDAYIIEELCLAGIPIVYSNDISDSEVSYSCTGELNGFRFQRAWYYWVVIGNMPLLYAKELYDNYKDLNIRVIGHCGNQIGRAHV